MSFLSLCFPFCACRTGLFSVFCLLSTVEMCQHWEGNPPHFLFSSIIEGHQDVNSLSTGKQKMWATNKMKFWSVQVSETLPIYSKTFPLLESYAIKHFSPLTSNSLIVKIRDIIEPLVLPNKGVPKIVDMHDLIRLSAFSNIRFIHCWSRPWALCHPKKEPQ